METTKLGRCKCEDEGCTSPYHRSVPKDPLPGEWHHVVCGDIAVRMVTVRFGIQVRGENPYGSSGKAEKAMCAACADFHEKGGAK